MKTADFRTYVTLEEAFIKRLVTAWQKFSSPVYASIAEACTDKNWNAARSLVQQLDFTELGNQNKQWVKYMLLSFAIHGANMVAKGQPNFVGVGSFDSKLNLVVSSVLQYLEHNATTQVQQSALQLIAQDEAATKVQKGEFKYGSTQVNIDDDGEMSKELNRLRDLIPEEDLAGHGKDVGNNHVTLRYGLISGQELIRKYLQSQLPFTMVLGKVMVFPVSDHSEGACPVVVQIISNDLKRMNDEIDVYGVWKQSDFQDYKPHATIAYVKPELAERYKLLPVQGRQYFVKSVAISDTDGVQQEIALRLSYSKKEDIAGIDLNVAGRLNPEIAGGVLRKRKKKVKKADEEGRYVTPFVSFDGEGDDKLQLIATLNGSRLATWGFMAEANVRGVKTYQVKAILDGRTCDFCEGIDGTEFDVDDATDHINDVLSVQDPNDLKELQPWPDQDEDSIAEYQDMTADELADAGLDIPPYHPGDRCICMLTDEDQEDEEGRVEEEQADQEEAEEEAEQEEEEEEKEQEDEASKEKPEAVEEDTEIPKQTVDEDTFQELGIETDPGDIDHYNSYVGISPVEMLVALSGYSPQEILDGELGDNVIKFLDNGDIATDLDGIMDDVKYSVGTVLDPYSGTYYLSEADLLTGDIDGQEDFATQLFTGLLDVGTSIGAKEVVVSVAEGEAVSYVQMGFLPSLDDWNSIRTNALTEIKDGDLKEMFNSLDEDSKVLIEQLLHNDDEDALSALVDLDLSYEGRSIADWILEDVEGDFSLDLTDDSVVQQARDYLGVVQKDDPYHDKEGKFTTAGNVGESVDKQLSAKQIAAIKSQNPARKAEQDVADKSEDKLSKALGIPRTGNNSAFDLRNDEVGIEVKTFVSNTNDKVTMSKEALGRKIAEAQDNDIRTYIVVADMRGRNSAKYYVSEKLGSLRLGSMTPVTISELRKMVRG